MFSDSSAKTPNYNELPRHNPGIKTTNTTNTTNYNEFNTEIATNYNELQRITTNTMNSKSKFSTNTTNEMNLELRSPKSFNPELGGGGQFAIARGDAVSTGYARSSRITNGCRYCR